MPVLYAPGVAESVKQYSEYFTTPQNAVYLSIDNMDDIEESLKNGASGRGYPADCGHRRGKHPGIGDWGTNGVSISTGKILVYTAAAGIDPAKVLPVVLDAGTNRQSLIDDPLYLGLHHGRISDGRYDAFVDAFIQTAEKLFPQLYIHFEDFGQITLLFNGDEEIASPSSRKLIAQLAPQHDCYLCCESGQEGDGLVRSRKGPIC